MRPEGAFRQFSQANSAQFRLEWGTMRAGASRGGVTSIFGPAFQPDQPTNSRWIDRPRSEKWFKPAKGQFQIVYRSGPDTAEYQPDFGVETKDAIYMLEPKARNHMDEAGVLAKRDAALRWCQRASDHSATCGGKPWTYALIPHDIIADNMTIAGLVAVATGRA